MTRPLVVMPDAALVMTTALRAALAARTPPAYATGATVANRNPPAADPGRFIRIRRSGGVPVSVAEDAPRLDFQVWHEDDAGRMALAMYARALVWSMPNTVIRLDGQPPTTIGQVTEFVGPGQFDDPIKTSREIILWTMEVRLRGAAA